MNPLTATRASFNVSISSVGPVAGTIVVAADGWGATFTSTGNLSSAATDVVKANGIVYLGGQVLMAFQSGFTTSF